MTRCFIQLNELIFNVILTYIFLVEDIFSDNFLTGHRE